jgi:hypothetical protein
MFIVNDWHVNLVDRLEGKSNFRKGECQGPRLDVVWVLGLGLVELYRDHRRCYT